MTTYIYNKVKKAVKAGMLALLVPVLTNLISSCQDKDWDAPSTEKGIEAYGNKYLKETNLKTIAEVLALYSNEIENNSLREVKQPMQIKGIVTGNDEEGNIYNSLYIQDNTAAIAISISQSGLYAALPVGQEILIELQGLYIGGYGKQPQIGTTYTNPNKEDAKPQVGRMSRYIWKDHYKLLKAEAGMEVSALEKKWSLTDLNMFTNCNRLVTLKGVIISDADGTKVFAAEEDKPENQTAVNHGIKNFSNMAIRTSTYADFAKVKMPTGRVDITGIATRYDETWQILMRTANDINPTSLADDDFPPVTNATGSGTKNDPYNVIGVFEAVKDLKPKATTAKDIYIKGYVSRLAVWNSQYGNISYFISDDPKGLSSAFYVYRGLSFKGEKFASKDDLKLGDEVVVCGKITNYNGVIEYASGTSDKNYLISLNGKTK